MRFRAFAATTGLGLPVVVQEFRPGENAAAALRRGGANLAELSARLGTWIGTLHTVRRDTFGAVTEAAGDRDWSQNVWTRMEAALTAVPEDALPPCGRTGVEAAFKQALGDLGPTGPASLVHGDLYLDNVLVDQGAAAALIDFEHAHFYDRFADFGKLGELLFAWWPGSEAPFLEAYREHFPADPGDQARIRVATGSYELAQLAYFSRWQADLVPVYRARLERWTEHDHVPTSRGNET